MNLPLNFNKIIIIVIVICVIIILLFTFIGYQLGFKKGINIKESIVNKHNTVQVGDNTNNNPTQQDPTAPTPPPLPHGITIEMLSNSNSTGPDSTYSTPTPPPTPSGVDIN